MAAKISIIMPAYNVEAVIGKAIDSVLAQTMGDLELVCVDDCSTDGTAGAIEAYAARDGRVKLIRQPRNSGILVARRTGALAATGDYVMWLDSDDLLPPEACERALRAMEEHRADIIQFKTIYRAKEGFESAAAGILERDAAGEGSWEGVKPGVELLDAFFISKTLHWTVWSKICTREVIRKAFTLFGEERCDLCEDAMICFLLLVNAQRVVYLPEALYIYHIGVGITAAPQPRHVQAVATEYRLYQLLVQGLTEAQMRDGRVSAALAAVHDALMDGIMWNLLHIDQRPILESFMGTLMEHCTPVALAEELKAYLVRTGQLDAHVAPPPQRGILYRGARKVYRLLKRALGKV